MLHFSEVENPVTISASSLNVLVSNVISKLAAAEM